MLYTIENKYLSAVISSKGGQLLSLKAGDEELLIPGQEEQREFSLVKVTKEEVRLCYFTPGGLLISFGYQIKGKTLDCDILLSSKDPVMSSEGMKIVLLENAKVDYCGNSSRNIWKDNRLYVQETEINGDVREHICFTIE